MRWICPTCGKGGLGPERPRRDDVRRYCLACSKRTGRLVERVAPVLVKRRETAQARRTVRESKLDEREAERWTVAGEDVRKLSRRCWRALAAVVKEQFDRRRISALGDRMLDPRSFPVVTLRRRRPDKDGRTRGRSGWAYGRRAITLMVPPDCTRPTIRELVVHELSHCARNWLTQTDPRADGPHGDTFNKLMVLAAERLWGVVVGVGPPGYWSSRALERALTRLEPEAVPEKAPPAPPGRPVEAVSPPGLGGTSRDGPGP